MGGVRHTGICRSFLVVSNVSNADVSPGADGNSDLYKFLFPNQHTQFEKGYIQTNLVKSAGKGRIGIAIELFAAGRQIYKGEPVFRLFGILPDSAPGDQHVIRRMYDRPIIPLGGGVLVDNLNEKPTKSLLASRPPPPLTPRVPRNSNDRVTLYVYDEDKVEGLDELEKSLGPYVLLPYAFATAVVFSI